jgi:hypothetical protein
VPQSEDLVEDGYVGCPVMDTKGPRCIAKLMPGEPFATYQITREEPEWPRGHEGSGGPLRDPVAGERVGDAGWEMCAERVPAALKHSLDGLHCARGQPSTGASK